MGSKSYKRILFFALIFSINFLATITARGQMRQVYLDTDQQNEIKKMSFYTPSEGYIATTKWVGYTIDSGRTVTKKFITLSNVNYNGYSVNLTFGFGINGVKAFNQNTFIVYGDYGLVPAILYTTNGGTSYTLIFQSQFAFVPNSSITDMVFPQNGSIGYAIDFDRILKTTNGGLTWSVIRIDAGSDFDHLESIDDNNLIAMSTEFTTNKLLKTSNGGTSWQAVSLPAIPSGKIYYAHFLTATIGWVNMKDNNQNQYLYKTINGGTSWTLVNDIVATPFACSKFKFLDNNVGYALYGFTILKTTNGGAVWEPLPRDNNYSYLGYGHNDLHILNTNQLWAGGGHGFLELSTNGGGTPLPKAYFKIDTTSVYMPPYTVSLLNFSNPSYSFKWYVNNNLISTSYNTTFSHNLSNQVDSIKLIVTSGTKSDTLLINQYYVVPNLPIINTFYPQTGSAGTFISILGSGFSGVNQVKFGGVIASSFNVISDTKITATVATGASGTISVTTINGTFSKPGFTYYLPYTTPPPKVNSITPQSGSVGTAVIITGNNFNSNPINNEVFFGATKASVTTATNTQINCIVPIGASFEEISVLNKSTNQIGQSLKPFNVTFADSSNFTPNSFVAAHTFYFPNNVYPRYVSAKDIDGDGKPDVVAHLYGDSLSFFRNISTINNLVFEPPYKINMPYPVDVWTYTFNDIDGDGKPDFVSSTNSNYIIVSRNLSTPGIISFDSLTSVLTAPGTHDVKVADLDNDGKNDIIIGCFNSSQVSIVRNTSNLGQLSFAQPINITAGGNPRNVAIGDIDGDGKKDIISYNNIGNGNTNFSYYKNTSSLGNISFGDKVDIAVPNNSSQGFEIRLADFDNDNKLDVFVLNDESFNVFRNVSIVGSIVFLPVNTFIINGTGQGGDIANLSGSTKPDIISGNWSIGQFTLFKNSSQNNNINFENGDNVVDPNYPYHTYCTDFDLDGKVDVLASNSNGHSIQIFKNKIGIPINIPLCSNSSNSIVTALVSDITGTSYQWQEDSGSGFINVINSINISGTQTNTLNLSGIPFSWNGRKYRCFVNNSKYSSQFILNISNIQPPNLVISSTAITICEGYFATFTATPSYTGIYETYQWKINGIVVPGISSTLTTSNLTNNSVVECIISTYTGACNTPLIATSNQITMNVVPFSLPTISIIGVSNVCPGNSNTFTATILNGGSSPSYQWQVNGVNVGTNSNTFTTNTLTNNAQVKCILTSNATCANSQTATSNVINITVNSVVVPAVSIISTATCAGYPITFTATPLNGGSAPTYQWQVNTINVGTNSNTFTSSTLNNNDQVKCILTSNAACANPQVVTSNTIAVAVNSTVAPTVAITSTATNICSGSSITFTATLTNGGAAPSYQWQVNGANVGTNSNTFTSSSLNNASVVKVIMTSSLACAVPQTATSNAINITVNNTIVPVASFTSSTTNICSGASITFTSTSTNTGTAPIYQWKKNGINVGTNTATYTSNGFVNGDVVTLALTSNVACASNTAIVSSPVIIIVATEVPAITIAGNTTVVINNTTNITSSTTFGGALPTYQWQDSTNLHTWANISGATNASLLYTPLATGNKLKCLITSNSTCALGIVANSNVLTFNVTPSIVAPNPTGEYTLRYFPNPVHTNLTIDSLQLSKEWESVKIITADGVEYKSLIDILVRKTKVSINVEALVPGVYFLVLTRKQGVPVYVKFIKE
jgi:photosystem II stability/assembly factor-like uncharacterized protein